MKFQGVLLLLGFLGSLSVAYPAEGNSLQVRDDVAPEKHACVAGKKQKRDAFPEPNSGCFAPADSKRDTLLESDKTNELQRRALAPLTAADIPAHIDTILNAATTSEIISDLDHTAAHMLPATHSFTYATKNIALQGCTILIAHNATMVYFAHLWEVPGFSKGGSFTKDEFQSHVIGFLQHGSPTHPGTGPALVGHMSASKVKLVTVSKGNVRNSAWYPAKIRDLSTLTGSVGTNTPNHYYIRPDDANPVRLTIEFDHTAKQLRVLLKEHENSVWTGYTVLDETL